MTTDPYHPPQRRGITMTQPLWTYLISHLLSHMHPNSHPALTLLHAMHDKFPPVMPPVRNPHTKDWPSHGPLARMERGLHALGALKDIAATPNHTSGCCSSIPLWNNPYITFRIPTSSTHALQHIATYPHLRTIGDLAQLRFNLSCRQQPDALTNRQAMKHAVEFMWLVIPHKWRDSIPTPTSFKNLSTPTAWGPITQQLLGRLGWHVAGAKTRLLHLNVRRATRTQLQSFLSNRTTALLRHISTSSPPPAEAPGDSLRHLKSSISSMWKMKWELRNKETYWRLVNNGISGAGGHDSTTSRPCPCGWIPPDKAGGTLGNKASADAWRIHAFWNCAVAQAVVNEINHSLGITDLMQRHHLWLSIPPMTHNPINLHIWQVVTLAAVTAMDHGRKAMHAMLKSVPATPPPQHQRTPALSVITRAANAASGRFWCILQDYVDTDNNITPPPPPNHPFFTTKDNHLTLNLPPPDRLPVDLYTPI
jgi:hypothetical protein